MNHQQGQSLVEILVAMSVTIIVVTSMSYAVINSLKNAQYGRNQAVGTQYTTEGMELVRSQRYSDYATFKTLSGKYCLDATCQALVQNSNNKCGPISNLCINTVNVGTAFSRVVEFQKNATPCNGGTQVSVYVSWADGRCSNPNVFCQQVSQSSCITTYDVNPTP